MVKEIRIYIEGGGRGGDKNASIKFRQGFHTFLKELVEQARTKNVSWNLIPCGSTDEAYRNFERSVDAYPQSFNVLVVDADEAVAKDETARSFLQNKHRKWKLNDIDDEQCHLMVQIMESWFIADIDALKNYYGQGFKEKAIPNTEDVETIDKPRVEIALKKATKDTRKGEYHKIKHGCDLLEKIDSTKVRHLALRCEHLFREIKKKIS